MASASSTPRQDQSQLPQALTFADIQEQAHAATSRVLESILKGKSFDRTKVADWVGEANRQVTQGLEDLSKVRYATPRSRSSSSRTPASTAEFQVRCEHHLDAEDRCGFGRRHGSSLGRRNCVWCR